MYANNEKISSRQTFRLYVFDLIGMGTLLIPPYLAKLSGSDGVLALLIGCLLGYGYLRYLGVIIRNMGMDLESYLKQHSPIWVQKIVFGFVFVHCVFTAGFALFVFCNLMQYGLVREVDYGLLLLVTVLVAMYSVSGGIENRARIYEVLFWFVLIPYGIMMLMSIRDFEPVYMNHFGESGPVDFVKSIYLVFLFLTPLFFMLFLYGNKEEKKNDASWIKSISFALLLASVILIGSYLLLLGNFGQTSLSGMRFPVVTIMSTIQFKGSFLKRMDAPMLAVWFVTLFAFLNLHLHYGTKMLRNLVKKCRRSVVLVAAVLTWGCAYILKNEILPMDVFFGYYSYVAVPLFVFAPGLLLLCKRNKKVVAMALVLFLMPQLMGCQATDLENRCFPMMVAVDYDKERGQVLFYESFPEGQTKENGTDSLNEVSIPIEEGTDFRSVKKSYEDSLSKVVDYNHLKVIVFGKAFLEEKELAEDMLKELRRTEEFPRNTYVCVTDRVEDLLEVKEVLPQEIGTFLEEYLENHEEKNKGLLSLGDLMDEVENQELRLSVPNLTVGSFGIKWESNAILGKNQSLIE